PTRHSTPLLQWDTNRGGRGPSACPTRLPPQSPPYNHSPHTDRVRYSNCAPSQGRSNRLCPTGEPADGRGFPRRPGCEAKTSPPSFPDAENRVVVGTRGRDQLADRSEDSLSRRQLRVELREQEPKRTSPSSP